MAPRAARKYIVASSQPGSARIAVTDADEVSGFVGNDAAQVGVVPLAARVGAVCVGASRVSTGARSWRCELLVVDHHVRVEDLAGAVLLQTIVTANASGS